VGALGWAGACEVEVQSLALVEPGGAKGVAPVQALHTELPAELQNPEQHSQQVPPDTALNVPAGQPSHADAPALAWVPLPQTVQVDDCAPATEPAGQATQAAEEVDPVWEFAVPEGQGVQAA